MLKAMWFLKVCRGKELLIAIVFSMMSSIRCEYGESPFGTIGSFPTNFFNEIIPKFVNDRPTIGIVAMESHGDKIIKESPHADKKDYFGASFVKLVESAGGRAVPIKEDDTDIEVKHLLRKINGVVLPGGDSNLGDTGYERISKLVIDFSRSEAKKNVIFPVLGICRGSQMIIRADSAEDILVPTDSLNLSLPLEFTKEASQSRLFGHAPPGLVKVLKTKAITFNAHEMGVPVKIFYEDDDLVRRYRIISTNFDRNGVEFISTFEGRDVPLYGLQWHPEKALAIYNPALAIDHTIYSITVAQYIANTFMSDARQNSNRFASRPDEENNLLFKYTPTYIGNITETPYEQIYIFDYVDPFLMNKVVNPRSRKHHKKKKTKKNRKSRK